MSASTPDDGLLTEAERGLINIEIAALRAGHVHMRDVFGVVERILASRLAAHPAADTEGPGLEEVIGLHPGWTQEVDEKRTNEHAVVWRFRCSGRSCRALLGPGEVWHVQASCCWSAGLVAQRQSQADVAHRAHLAAAIRDAGLAR